METLSKPMTKVCPKCLHEGKRAEIFEGETMKRCLRCSYEYNLVVKPGAVSQKDPVVRGLKSILG